MVSWFDADDRTSLAGDDVVILGGPIRNASFVNIRQQLLADLPRAFQHNLPFDFSNHVYSSQEPYTSDPRNGIVVGYDDAGDSLAEADAMKRYCQRDGEVWYFRSVLSSASSDPLCPETQSESPNREPQKWPATGTGHLDYAVDYGFFLIGPNPFDHQHQLILMSGTHSPGTAGALRYILKLSQTEVQQLEKTADSLRSPKLGYISGVLKVTPQNSEHPKLVRAAAF